MKITKQPINLNDGRKVSGPYSDGKSLRVKIKYPDGYCKKMSYSYFLIEMVTNTEISPNIFGIKHIDGNFQNNCLDNIRLLKRSNFLKDKSLLPNIFDTFPTFDEDKYNEIIDLFENNRQIKIY